MSDKIIIKNYLAKIKKLREHNNLYFNKNSPKISDEDYDKLKIEILDLEKKYPNIKSKDCLRLMLVLLRPKILQN